MNDSAGFAPLQPVARLGSTYPEALEAWIAEMEFACAPAILAVLRRNIEGSLLAYADVPIAKTTRAATAQWLSARFGYKPPAGSVFLTNNVMGGYEGVVRVLSQTDKPIIVPTPAYHLLLHTPRYFGRELIELPCVRTPEGRYQIDYQRLDEILVPGAIFTLTNPHNPVGQVYTQEELEQLAEIIEAHGALVYSDEVHCPLILDPQARHVPYATVSAAAAEHCVMAISASKSFNVPGLMCAQLIIPSQRLQQKWQPFAAFYADGVSRLGLYAAATAYQDPSCWEWLEGVRETLRSNLAFVQEYFTEHNPQIVLPQHQATYLYWLDLRACGLGPKPAAWLLEHARVALNEGADFGFAGHARLNIALQPERLRQVVQRISTALQGVTRAPSFNQAQTAGDEHG